MDSSRRHNSLSASVVGGAKALEPHLAYFAASCVAILFTPAYITTIFIFIIWRHSSRDCAILRRMEDTSCIMGKTGSICQDIDRLGLQINILLALMSGLMILALFCLVAACWRQFRREKALRDHVHSGSTITLQHLPQRV